MPEDFEAFLALLPREVDGRPLRHVLDVRHESFDAPEYLALARRYGCATVYTDSDKFPAIADAQGDLAYLRLMRSEADCANGLPARGARPVGAGRARWTDAGPGTRGLRLLHQWRQGTRAGRGASSSSSGLPDRAVMR